MYIYIAHNSKAYHKKNYKKYTKEKFLDLVHKIASEHGVNNSPEIIIDKLDTPGKCWILGSEIGAIFYDKKLLNGKDYTISDVEEVIKHELAHYIADSRYKVNCHHDIRWKKVAKEIGCSPSEMLSPRTEARLNIDKFEPISIRFNYYLRCNECNKLYYETDTLSDMFIFFLISGTDISPFALTFNGLPMKTECCNSPYKFEANAEMFLQEIDNTESFKELKEKIIKIFEEGGDKNKRINK